MKKEYPSEIFKNMTLSDKDQTPETNTTEILHLKHTITLQYLYQEDPLLERPWCINISQEAKATQQQNQNQVTTQKPHQFSSKK